MDKEIKELIKKNLPQIAADELTDFIQEANANKTELQGAEIKIKELSKTIKDQTTRITKLMSIVSTEQVLETKKNELFALEISLAERENAIELLLTRQSLKDLQTSKDDMMNLVSKVFGHPNVTVTTDKSVPQETDQYGNTIYPPMRADSTHTTTTQGKD